MFFYSSRHQLALYSFPTRRSSDLIRIGVEPRVSEVPRRGPAVTTSEVVVTAGSVRREDGSGAGPLPALGRCSRRRSEEHTSELQSRGHLVCRLLLEKKKRL